jgi:PBP1b-binding outer membrane lipoprotein LpoB
MRLVLLAAFAAALILFGCVTGNSPDQPNETPATPSVSVPVSTPSVEAPVTEPVTKTSTKQPKHHHHHHRRRHPAQQPEPAAGTANQTPFFFWNGSQSN